MAQIRPFHSETSEEQLADLRERLARTRFAPALSGRDWTHGTPPGYLAELLEYWRTEFDWGAAEKRLNTMPQFLTEVGGNTLHFVHARGVGPRPLPLLFSHGWPGSFYEVTKIIGPLTDPAAHGGDPADAFDVVAPSLPGFGHSPHPGTPGINPTAIAELFHQLMTEVLGYSRYGAQGGDFGAQVTSRLGRDHGDTLADVESVFSKDEMLTDITLYWLTNSIATSARLYYETMHTEGMLGRNVPGYVETPTGFASFAKDNFTPPEEWVRRCYNLQRFTEFDRGGHFAALERPEELVTEIREFFRPLRG
jgi:pimeloyl-ACP methyl ester carboxylesterase